jgi:hypothetical protein
MFNGRLVFFEYSFFPKKKRKKKRPLLTSDQVYCIFGTFCTVAAIHVFLLFPETCGKTLEEIDEVFNDQSIWAFKAKHEPSRLIIDVELAKEDLRASKVGVIQFEQPK